MRKLALLIGLCGLFASPAAEAAPGKVTFTGRLTNASNQPVTGPVNLTFNLFSTETGGTSVWTETKNNVAVAGQGLVFVDLGDTTTLDMSDFPGGTMYLEVTVGAEVLGPRVAINSVPYALQADNAGLLGGSIAAADVITSAAGTNGITAAKSGNALSVSLATTGCSAGQVYKYNGTAFACADDADTAPAAGAGIAVSGSTISLSTTGCVGGEVWKFNGTTWSCEPDADTVPVAGAGIAVSGATVSLSTTGCLAGYVWKYNGTVWACSADAGTTYTAGTGISISGTTLSVDSTIVARKDSAAGNQAFDGSTLVLDYTNNRVGIGTTTPVSPLEVVGDVRATSYRYSPAATGSVLALASDCIRGVSADPDLDTGVRNPPSNSFGPSIWGIPQAANTQYQWVCPVNIQIPPGTTLIATGGSMGIYDGSTTCRVQGELRTKTFGSSSNGTIHATAFSGVDAADFAATPGLTLRPFPAISVVIGADTVLWAHATIAHDATGGGDCRFQGIRLNYTIQ